MTPNTKLEVVFGAMTFGKEGMSIHPEAYYFANSMYLKARNKFELPTLVTVLLSSTLSRSMDTAR